jgi:hypothetical protein
LGRFSQVGSHSCTALLGRFELCSSKIFLKFNKNENICSFFK